MDAQAVGKKILDHSFIVVMVNYFNDGRWEDVKDEIQAMKAMKIQDHVIYYYVPSAIMMHSDPLKIMPKIKKIINEICSDPDAALLLFQQTAILATRGVTRLREAGIIDD